MAECHMCQQDTSSGASCHFISVRLRGAYHARVVYGKEAGAISLAETCPGCGVALGGVHHYGLADRSAGCPVEQCPVCGRPLHRSESVSVWCECGDPAFTKGPPLEDLLPPGISLSSGVNQRVAAPKLPPGEDPTRN